MINADRHILQGEIRAVRPQAFRPILTTMETDEEIAPEGQIIEGSPVVWMLDLDCQV
ncbi:hypothetical protein [Pseudomonas putida]|uniref:hypothetical protein n=1 Tax=Pseudomonas putida TaxID=303 RepID=UPI0015B917F8|nr:hypothetical protein [Pseudomonas putida]